MPGNVKPQQNAVTSNQPPQDSEEMKWLARESTYKLIFDHVRNLFLSTTLAASSWFIFKEAYKQGDFLLRVSGTLLGLASFALFVYNLFYAAVIIGKEKKALIVFLALAYVAVVTPVFLRIGIATP